MSLEKKLVNIIIPNSDVIEGENNFKQDDAPTPVRSEIIYQDGVLHWKSQINGVPKLQGVFKLQDQEGFPLDMVYEIAKEKGWDIDWVEALADAASQCVFKFKALMQEIGMLEPSKLESIKHIFACGLLSCEGEAFQEKAINLHNRMKS